MENIEILEWAHRIIEDRVEGESFDGLIPSGLMIAVLYADPQSEGSAMQFATVGSMNTFALEGVLGTIYRDITKREKIEDDPYGEQE